MLRWQTLMGVVLGLGIAVGISSFVGNGGSAFVSGPVLSEYEGHLRELVIHYEPSAHDIVLPVYRQFLPLLESDVTVYVVAPSVAAFEAVVEAAGPVRAALRPIIVDHPMTAWSRDRWLALGGSNVVTLWHPRGENGADLWPERAGDQRVAYDVAKALHPAVRVKKSSLYFDGGDFFADSENVFVMPRLLQRNIQHTVTDRQELVKIFSGELKRRVILLNEAPDHHAAMFMASIGKKTMLVGDPRLGRRYVTPSRALELLPGGADFTAATQQLFDAVAVQGEAAGYTVVRIPTLVSPDGRTFLTYVNSVMDEQGGRRIVYLPFYQGADSLNAVARQTWESLGFEVRPVDSTSTYRHFGSIHCLVNVLSRAPQRGAGS
jgi:hypothetical protein